MTIEAIQASYRASRNAINGVDSALADELAAIKSRTLRERRRPTPAEKARRKEVWGAQDALAEQRVELDLQTLRVLDDDLETKQLLADLDSVTKELEDDLAGLKKVSGYAATVANVFDELAKTAGLIAKFAA